MRSLVVFLCLIFCCAGMNATPFIRWPEQTDNSLSVNPPEDNIDFTMASIPTDEDSPVFVPETWDVNFDNLLNSWHTKHYIHQSDKEGYHFGEPACDSIYKDRLSKLPCIIDLPYNETVRSCIDLYVDRRRKMVEYMLGLQAFYFPMIEQTLDSYGLPLELKYLAVVESALNPTALSRAGASGLWQFMLPTGKFYDLEINSLVDERRDPVKSTDAACRYLKDLHETYGDWNLAIAAYNCGPGNVNKAIKRANGKKDYWAIYPYLPKETRAYVPFFIAANYVMNYYSYHNLYPVETDLSLSVDTVMVNDQIHFDQIAEILKIGKDEIRALNPQYKEDIIPGISKSRPLKLPSVYAYAFVELQDSIVNHRTEDLFANRTYLGDTNSREKKTHKVKNGENLTMIANKYGVTATELRKWNRLKSNKVKPGRNLTVYVDNGGYTLNNQSTTASSSKKTTSSKSKIASAPRKTNSTQYGKYTIKQGDSYYTIAKKYPGCSPQDLMKINNTKSAKLVVGQTIKVPRI